MSPVTALCTTGTLALRPPDPSAHRFSFPSSTRAQHLVHCSHRPGDDQSCQTGDPGAPPAELLGSPVLLGPVMPARTSGLDSGFPASTARHTARPRLPARSVLGVSRHCHSHGPSHCCPDILPCSLDSVVHHKPTP